MMMKISERQRKIVFQALTNYEFEIKKVICEKEMCNDEEALKLFKEYEVEVYETLMLFE